ncbi:MAG: transketolase family protein [Minisyncoccia bacterium]
MLNQDLNQKLFEENVDRQAIRDGFGQGLLQAAEENENVVALCSDLKESTRLEEFSKKYPNRFFEIGIAEQNMATIAAGFGISNKIPFIASYAVFSPGRNWEQIRTTIAYNDSNVKIAGHHAGLLTGPDGATHQALEDIALMRVLPNMKVFVPCDAIQAKKMTLIAAKIWGPVYIRLQRESTPIITTEQTPLELGKAQIFWQSKKPEVLIIGCGSIIYNALLAAKKLEKEKINTIVVNMPIIKPLDTITILELVKKTKAVVTVEEHQIAGGLGGAIAEFLAKTFPVPMEFIGMQDSFGESGNPYDLIEKYNMGVKAIELAVKKVLKRK